MEMAPRSDSSTGSVAIDPFTRGSRHRRRRPLPQEIRHCQRAASPSSSLKANPSPARVAVASSVASAEDIAAFQAVEDGLVGKMYRFRERRLELQQQHHKCKSSRRTVEDRGSVASSGGGKVVSLNGGNCEGSASSVGEEATLGRRNRRSGHFWVASAAGRTNVLLAVVLFLLAGFCTQSGCDDTEQFQKNIPARIVWAAVDHDAELPCDITAPGPQDGVKLVLWFKDSTGIPLYSLDSRSGVAISAAQHSTIASDLGQRLFFSLGTTPKEARLQIRNIKPSDGGVYRCRVDYFNSPTRNYRVNLTLVVPPEEPRIFDAQGKEISSVAGPFREGHELFLSCQVSGGRPAPRVTWWHDGVEISGTSHPSAVEGAAAMVNQLFMGTVSRDLYGAKFVCRAAGSKLVPPVSKEVAIQVHLKPLRAKIVTPNELLTAGRPIPIRCESWGSFPAAKIVWLLDGEPLRSADITVHSDNNDANLTSSILTLRVTAENDGAELSCRATNPWFSGGAVEDKRIISVAYEPVVSVHLANEDPSRVITRAEGENVTLKCRADARPPVTSFAWYKNNMRMSGESGETLHLVQLERESAGSYACAASNTEGETRSSSITLKVQYAPRCKPGTEQTSVGSLNMHSMHVRCEVEADPPDGVRFSWTYNNTRNVSPVLNSRVSSHGLVSTMTYLPQSDAELVTLACWAINAVGRQTQPCLIHILPAKIPDPPRNCELRNDTVLEVVCQPGSDGGLVQSFLLEVVGGAPPPLLYGAASSSSLDYTRSPPTEMLDNEISTMNDQATLAPLFRIQELLPQFKLHSLEPGRDYQLLVYAVNGKGRSDPPFVIDKVRVGAALVPPYVEENIISEDPTPAETSNADKQKQQSQMVVFAAVAAAAGVVITSVIVAGFVAICRLKRPKPPEPQEVRKRMRPARTDVPSMYAEDDVFEDEYQRGGQPQGQSGHLQSGTDPRCSRASSTLRSSRYISEGFVQYSQPSLNVYIADPDLILPRGTDVEFTTLSGA
ncbi:hemicentin-2 isoform X3 [Culex quinquefasciatus]|uniref:hemicentin-2 isoform X3 n=1 Tax=Culex quinquefasciatus TaxID=7176 RepID=UPI0018E3F34E|nr:hemicentin-2 isoform X3 [Culex quinquefasciatus]